MKAERVTVVSLYQRKGGRCEGLAAGGTPQNAGKGRLPLKQRLQQLGAARMYSLEKWRPLTSMPD